MALASRAGHGPRAIRLCNLGLNRRPSPEIERALRLERAAALAASGAWARAELDYRHALERLADARTHVLLARCLTRQKRHAEAVAELERAIELEPERAEAWQLLTRALSAGGKPREAVAAARAAWELEASAPALFALVQALAASGRHHEAIELAERELARRADDAALWAALGVSLNALGRTAAAIEACRRAIELDPERTDARCGLAFALLRQGRFGEGFRHNEYRQRNAGDCRRLGVPPWRGEPLDAEHLLIWCEQGFGDTLQFVRFMPLARRVAARTSLAVAPSLVRLLQHNPELGPITTRHPGFGAADRQALVMSLPHQLGLGDDVGAAPVPYLFAEPELVARWRARLPRGPKVALVWQGNPAYAGDAWRSMPFAHYAPLLVRFGERVHFLALQKHFGREQLGRSELAGRVLDLADSIDAGGDAFVDSLAILSEVDLLITTDTSIAHLAGGAGVRTWLLLSEIADWRWGIEGDRTIWYPSVRLFRQRAAGDWDGVLGRVLVELEGMLRSKLEGSARAAPGEVR